MTQHLDTNRLYATADGMCLDESENNHLAYCELCQELLVFFEARMAEFDDGAKAA